MKGNLNSVIINNIKCPNQQCIEHEHVNGKHDHVNDTHAFIVSVQMIHPGPRKKCFGNKNR